MKKKILNIILIVTSTLSVAACSPKTNVAIKNDTTKGNVIAETNGETITTVSNDSRVTGSTKTVTKAKEGSESQDSTKEDTESNAEDNKSSEAKEESQDTKAEGENSESSGENKISIVTKDPQNFEKKEVKALEIDSSKPMEENLQAVADEVSKSVFDGNEIKVKEIKEEDGKKVAHIDLVNKEKWNNYFQGSTGGSITQFTLIDSFLQREYKGEWIDGVKFTIDDTDIEYEHTPSLSSTRFKVEEGN